MIGTPGLVQSRVATVATVLGCSLAGYAHAAPPQVASAVDFCTHAQQTLAGTKLVSRNVIHSDYEAFKKSKASIQPLITHQFVLYEDDARQRPLRISCKLKTPDLLNEVHGAGTATDTGKSCRTLNRATVLDVYRDLSPPDRARAVFTPRTIMLEADQIVRMGSQWITDFDYMHKAGDGTLHIVSKSLRVDWDDWRFKIAPDRLRGTWYCHLIAPEHMRRIMLGGPVPPSTAR